MHKLFVSGCFRASHVEARSRPATRRLAIASRTARLFTLAIFFTFSVSIGQSLARTTDGQIPGMRDDITISPSRLELPMLPGSEQTVVVNLIYSSDTGDAQPARIVAYLGDWTLEQSGRIDFFRPGTLPNSAARWMIYSPSEATVQPGKTHSIRVTVSVPDDIGPGDYLAALFVESRPDNIRSDNTNRLQMRFRLAAAFYVMVPELSRRGSLEDLHAEATPQGIVVTPHLANTGNSHLRPLYSIAILDRNEKPVAGVEEAEALPVLGGSRMQVPLLVEAVLPAGIYTVRYRVDFRDGEPGREGVTEVEITEEIAREAASRNRGVGGRSVKR